MTTKAIDFSKLDMGAAHEKGFRVEIVHPVTNEPLGSAITIRGDESPVVQAFLRKLVNAGIKRAAKGDTQTIEEAISDTIEKLTVSTLAWENVAWDGAELPCTPENCRKLYNQKWLRDQVAAKQGEDANFPLG